MFGLHWKGNTGLPWCDVPPCFNFHLKEWETGIPCWGCGNVFAVFICIDGVCKKAFYIWCCVTFPVNFTEKKNLSYFLMFFMFLMFLMFTSLFHWRLWFFPCASSSAFSSDCPLSVYKNKVDANNSQDQKSEGQEQLLLICNIRKKKNVSVTFPPICLPHSWHKWLKTIYLNDGTHCYSEWLKVSSQTENWPVTLKFTS